ncbi:saccharopine dehydrogenase NADP-binding domain-containing protein [Paraconexibacter antarcticus]|uniref:Saccharopine dehydrogenase NADP-binding domain-containing protein n=1 Tax=Paraconexibacter antarcticus TaxID=2949664 RepID=A0ABY5DY28_9ACTN|nr:saccharopine dehydrogenase NADP-binding domain-containing protein [Paraconexibacter antarcticus]UTI65535.1 saccharopine dehydrogenase NADP-binding domain-containing protein [Paraconexibacter antarcticus]
MRIAVLGAGGIIAPAIVRDLAGTPEVDGLTLLDLDGDAARRVATEHGGDNATGAAVDGTDRQALMLAIEGHGLLVNAASYRTNLAAMDAALVAGVNYLDLGGLYHVTRHQLTLGPAFAAAGLLAVLGCGAGPGKTNVLAVQAARLLSRVDEVRCASAGHDETPPATGLAVPYALQTLLDELTEPPMVVRDGVAGPVAPMSAGGLVRFPDPIGLRPTLLTLHSEVATLPASLGAPAADFRLALAPHVEAALRAVVASGVRAADIETVPSSPRTWSAQHVALRGLGLDGATPQTVVATALTPPHEAWGLGGGIVSTGSVAAATARLLARGAVGALAGVLPVEQVLTPELLLPELEARGTVFTLHIDSHDEVSTP